MRSLLLAFTIGILWPSLAWTGEKRDATALAKTLAPYVDDMTFAIGHLDAKTFDIGSIFKLISGLDIKDKDLDSARAALTKAQTIFRDMGGRDVFFLFNWDAPRMDQDFVVVVPLEGEAKAEMITGLFAFIPNVKTQVRDNTLVITTARNMDRLKSIKPRERPELPAALSAFSDQSAKVLILPPRIVVRTLVELFPQLPPQLGKGSTRELGAGLQWAGIGLSNKQELTFRLQAGDEKVAQQFQDLIRQALDIPIHDPNLQLLIPNYAKLREKLIPAIQGNKLVLVLDKEVMNNVFGPLAKEARGSAGRAQSANNLKQIAIAFHIHHDAKKALPGAAIRDAKGRALLSWRVQLLPYLEQEALYRQFKLDEPWDSEHNKKFIEMIPPVFASPLSPGLEKGKTTYLVPIGKGTIFADKKGVNLTKIPDGTSNTIITLETNPSHAVVWTKPDDFLVDQKDLLKGLVLPERKGFHAAFADGSVRWIHQNVDLMTLRALLTANGGETVDFNVLDGRLPKGK